MEDELDFALGKQTPAFLRKCVCYIRKISNFDRFAKLPEMARYMDIVVSSDRVMRNQEAYERLLKIRDEFIPTVVAASNLRVYSSVTHCDMKLGYSQEVESNYVEGLCKQFYEDMVDIIQATVQQNFDTETDPLYDEILQHLSLCKSYAALYQFKTESLDYIQEYLLPSKGSRMSPLVVYGGPCTGKTLLLSEVAKQVSEYFYFFFYSSVIFLLLCDLCLHWSAIAVCSHFMLICLSDPSMCPSFVQQHMRGRATVHLHSSNACLTICVSAKRLSIAIHMSLISSEAMRMGVCRYTCIGLFVVYCFAFIMCVNICRDFPQRLRSFVS